MSEGQETNHGQANPADADGLGPSYRNVVVLFPLFVAGYAIAIGLGTLLATNASTPTLATMGVGLATVLIAILFVSVGGLSDV